ncbi:hypothetical protein TNCV_3541951 [Trichonephila clavipes]|nr:hypothetical protein TNCV_3541951 [Trichonephila clavipes]
MRDKSRMETSSPEKSANSPDKISVALPRELTFIRPQNYIQKNLDFHLVCLTRNCKNQNDAPGLRALVPAPGLEDKDMHRTYVTCSTPSLLSRNKPC